MKSRGRVLISTGVLLIMAAFLLTGYNLYEDYQAGRSSNRVLQQMENAVLTQDPPKSEEEYPSTEENEDDVFNPNEHEENQDTQEWSSLQQIDHGDSASDPDREIPVKMIDGVEYIGVLRIPAIDLELPVIAEWTKWNLRKAPCRYSGSPYKGDMIIAGHNYAAHFRDLKALREGDLAIFTDMDGNILRYQMISMEVLRPTQVEDLKDGKWDLTLFTCTSDWRNRMVFRFQKVILG